MSRSHKVEVLDSEAWQIRVDRHCRTLCAFIVLTLRGLVFGSTHMTRPRV